MGTQSCKGCYDLTERNDFVIGEAEDAPGFFDAAGVESPGLSVSYTHLPTGGKGGLDSLVLPAVTVGFGLAALITRTTRSSMLDVLRQDYMTTARAKGCSEKQVCLLYTSRRIPRRCFP